MKKIFYTLALAAMTFASCSKEANPSGDKPDKPAEVITLGDTFTCSLEGVKTTLSGKEVRWKTGDEISVNGAKYILEDGAGEHTATFKIAEGVENPTAIDYKGEKIFCAFFPAAGVTWNKDEGKFIYSFPSSSSAHTDVANDFSFSPMYAHWKKGDENITFYNITSMLKVDVDKNFAGSIKISSSENICGSATISGDGDKLVLDGSADNAKQITVNVSSGLSQNPTLYVVVPEITSATLDFEYKTDSDIWTKEIKNVTLANNKINKTTFTAGGTNVHHGIKIGSLYWADMNIGATSETDAGLYFSWGNIDGHTAGSYTFSQKNYESTGGFGLKANIPSDDPEHDAALANWGSSWRLPKWGECGSLSSSIKVTGSRESTSPLILYFTATATAGSAEIKFPAAGYIDGTAKKGYGESSNTYECRIWTGELSQMDDSKGYDGYMTMKYSSNSISNVSTFGYITAYNRYLGFTIRPVHD